MDQRIEGFANLRTGIRDLVGDGKVELVIEEPIVEHSCVGVVTWPAIYRFERGKYVEASREFPNYYDDEVLPRLALRIAKYQGKATDMSGDLGAGPTVERDKILRILGRDPTAGLAQAREWVHSGHPDLIRDAAVVFRDIGGYDDEARAADAALKSALSAQQARRNGQS